MKHPKNVILRMIAAFSLPAVCGAALQSVPVSAGTDTDGLIVSDPAEYEVFSLCGDDCPPPESAPVRSAPKSGSGTLPAKFDLRDEGAVTSVKSQYGGTCGLFSGIAAIESNMIKKGMADNTLDLSEEHLAYFAWVKGTPDDSSDPLRGDRPDGELSEMTHACSPYDLIGMLSSWIGVVPASMTPHFSNMEPLDESLRYASAAHLQNATNYDERDMDAIKRQLMKKGAMQLVYYSLESPKRYSEYGGYYQTLWGYREGKEGQSDLKGARHGVCLVGWDDNFPKEHFVETPPGDGAWICKNSWGKNSANTDQGYNYISYYDPSISGIWQYEMEPADNYDGIYQNCCWINTTVNLKNKGIYYANVFTADKDENITAAGIFTYTADVPFRFSLYALNEDFADPCDGTLLTQFRVDSLPAGYHTLPLDTVCQVSAGQQFSAVVEVGIRSNNYFCYDQGRIGERNTFVAIYTEDSEPQWVDAYKSSLFRFGNACIKLYTKDGTAISEQNYPDPVYQMALSQAYDRNEDCVITEQEIADAEPFIRGDLNRDGKVNAVDLSLIKQVLLGSKGIDLCLIAGDWNGDEAINKADAEGILHFLLQIPENP